MKTLTKEEMRWSARVRFRWLGRRATARRIESGGQARGLSTVHATMGATRGRRPSAAPRCAQAQAFTGHLRGAVPV